MFHPGFRDITYLSEYLKYELSFSNTCTAEMYLNMTIRGLAVKNITHKMNSFILTTFCV